MSGGVLELACRNSLRSSDTKVKSKGEKKMHSDEEDETKARSYEIKGKNRTSSTRLEKERIMIILSDDDDDDDDDEEKVESGKKLKNRKESTAIMEKEKRRRMPINPSDGDKEEELEMRNSVKKMKNKEEKRMCGSDDKVKNRKSAATFEKEKKRKMWNSYSGEEKMNKGGHDKDKKRSMTVPSNKNKDNLKMNTKIPSSNSSVKKTRSSDLHSDKRRNTIPSLDKSKHSEKEKKKKPSSHNGDKKMWYSDHDKDKSRSMPLPSKRNEMKVKNVDNKEEKKNAPPSLSKENKINSKENKRKASTVISKKAKMMRTDDNDKMMGGYDRGKEKKIQDDDKKQKSRSGDKEKKRSAPLAFFKVVWNNFEEFLLIPPIIAPKLADLTNRHVYLEDSEGKSSKIRLSVVEGSLAFYQGWNNFVSDHSVKWGDFLLFEYTALSKFSVRVFGMDSSERLCFNAEMKDGMKKQKESHAPGSLVPCNRDGNSEYINGRQYVSDERFGSKGPDAKSDGHINYCETASDNLVAKSLNAASGTRNMTVNTKGDPNRTVRGPELGSSVALDNKDGYLASGDHTAKNISPTCSKEDTRILVTDGSPQTQENEDTLKLTPLNAASGTRYLTANTKEDPKEVSIGAWCAPSVALDNNIRSLSTEECKTKSISPMCWKQRAGGSEVILITDASPLAQENDAAVKLTEFSHHIEGTSMIRQSDLEVVTPIKCMEINDSGEDLRMEHKGSTVQLECTTVVGKCPHNSKMNTNSNVLRKYEAPGGSRCLEKWKKDIVSGQAALDGTGPIRPENSQKIVDKLVGDCSVMGLNPVEQWPLGSDSTRSCLQPMPVKTEKSGHSGTSIHHSVDREGTTFQFRTKKEQLEPVGSTISRQKNDIPARANHAIARQSEHYFFRQEDVKPSNRASSVALMSVKVEVLELDGHSMLKTNLQFCIPSTTQTWLKSVKGRESHLLRRVLTEEKENKGKGNTVEKLYRLKKNLMLRAKKLNKKETWWLSMLNESTEHARNILNPISSFEMEMCEQQMAVLESIVDAPGSVSVAGSGAGGNIVILGSHFEYHLNCFYTELPKSLSNAIRQKGRLDRSIVMLKDPMKRLWPVFYHENPVFVGFTRGWKPFAAANNLETGHLCTLWKDMDEDEPVYHVNITKKQGHC